MCDTLGPYENPIALEKRFALNQVVAKLYKHEGPNYSSQCDERFDATVALATQLIACEKGEILKLAPLFKTFSEALLKPIVGTVEDALFMGSLIMPAIEAMLRIYKVKLPKKSSPEINAQVSLPLRETFKQLVVLIESFKLVDPVEIAVELPENPKLS